MLTCGVPTLDCYSGYPETWMGVNRMEPIELSENINGIHMLIVLLEEKVLQNEQEISHMQRIVWKLEQENDSLRDRIQRLESTVAEMWQNNFNCGCNDSGTYSEMSSELFEDRDHSEVAENQNGLHPQRGWTSAIHDTVPMGYDQPSAQLYWPSSQPLLCYFYGVPPVPTTFVNNEFMPFEGQVNSNSSRYYYNAYNM